MPIPYFALALTASLLVNVSDDVPKLDVTASCRGAATDAAPGQVDVTMKGCLDSEAKAREQLVQEWQEFTATERVKCVATVRGFEPTYSELITCLEMARDTRNAPSIPDVSAKSAKQ
jgi:hypothetical protein